MNTKRPGCPGRFFMPSIGPIYQSFSNSLAYPPFSSILVIPK
ncbi:MAG: hypothetical protein WBN50_09190 [Lutimonas sp.]